MEDLTEAGRNITFGTTGVGTGSQLAQTVLFKQADVKGTDVPFDGGNPALTALLGNQVELATIQLGEAMPQIKAGKVKPLVVFSEERNPSSPTPLRPWKPATTFRCRSTAPSRRPREPPRT